jgi:hypothetical protein
MQALSGASGEPMIGGQIVLPEFHRLADSGPLSRANIWRHGKRTAYEPMTLGNMCQHGMTRLDVSCHGPDCWHRANVDVSAFGGYC